TERFDLNVNEATISLPTVHLTDILDSPSKVQAVKVDSDAKITWLSPYDRTIYRRDGGDIVSQFGHNYMEELAVFGQVFRGPAKLYQMSWYLTFIDESHDLVNLFVFALDESGNPTSTILYERGSVPNIDDQWNAFIFPDTITVENGFYIALSYKGRLEIGIDAGADPWPYVNGVNWVAENYLANDFLLMEELGLGEIPGNLMIRAEGYNLRTGEKLQNLVSKNSKALNTYSVYRLKDGHEENTEDWTLIEENIPGTQYTITDNGLVGLEPGWYKYAIYAIYSGELESEVAFSNPVEHELSTEVTFNLTTNTNANESNGAVVTLTSTDGDYTYSKTLETNDGILVFNEVFKGVYNILIKHERFEDYMDTDVDLTTESDYTLNYELIEKLIMPTNLQVTMNDDLSAVFKWNYTANIIEGFEGCTDFAIAPKGVVDWIYFDLDMRPTVGINNFEYLNENAPHSFMAFNPSATTPPVDLSLNPTIAPYNGDKYLASFGVDYGQNDDYFISPKLNFEGDFLFQFWAKSFSVDPAPNKIRVGYSKTGFQPEDFTWLTEEPIDLLAVKWTQYSYSLTSDVKYVAINNVSDGGYILMIDDVEILGEELTKGKSFVNYKVYLNGESMGSTDNNTFNFAENELLEGENIAGVEAIYDSGASEMATITFYPTGNSIADEVLQAQMSIYPNPSNGTFSIKLDGKYEVQIVNITGALVYSKTITNNAVIDLENIASGVYVVTAKSDKKFAAKRIVIK
ncbi:MAG: T9SS type A sorting domain-containing protein, partial [Bacteroidales bacterium]|nr:T9SS type A sorting domain-containing protein [Bacteroidales bacterium]